MRKEELLYWKYYIPENGTEPPVIFSFFDIGDYKDRYIFVHVSSQISFNVQNDDLLQKLEQYTYPISKLEEDMLLDGMGINGKRQYSERLKALRFEDDYKLYSFSITPESTYILAKFFERTLDIQIRIPLENLE